MKKMFFAVAAAFVMVSVSNVFANSNVQLGNAGMAQVNDTVDTTVVAPADTVVTPATPEEPAPPATPAAPADSTAKPAVDSTSVAQ